MGDAGNAARQHLPQHLLNGDGMAALLMGNKEFAITMPGALLIFNDVGGVRAAHTDLELLKLESLRLTRILNGLLNLTDQS